MLKLHHKSLLRSIAVPSASHMQLSPVADEDDELISAIEHDHDDDVWTLEKTPDTSKLDEFWTGVEQDLKNDPSWFSFEND